MMEQYSGDFLAAVDGAADAARAASAACGRSASSRRRCARATATGRTTRGEVEVDAGQAQGQWIERIWLEPPAAIHPVVADGHPRVRRGHHRPGQLLHEPDAHLPRARRAGGARRGATGPIILVANLLTEGRGMEGFTAGDAVARIGDAIGRPVDVVDRQRRAAVRRACSSATPRSTRSRSPLGDAAGRAASWWAGSSGRAASRGTIGARLAYAVWSVLAQRLLD